MNTCNHCGNIIPINEVYISMSYNHFCDMECLDKWIKRNIKIDKSEGSCKDCCHCMLEGEISMFGDYSNDKCKYNEEIDCDDYWGCWNDYKVCPHFEYGERGESVYSYLSKSWIKKEPIKFNKGW